MLKQKIQGNYKKGDKLIGSNPILAKHYVVTNVTPHALKCDVYVSNEKVGYTNLNSEKVKQLKKV